MNVDQIIMLAKSEAELREAIQRLVAEQSAAVFDERERCCRVVYGWCSSDNEAQRIVDAIRKGQQ